MVSQLFTGFTQSLQGVAGPQVSPSALRGSATAPNDHYFIDFMCQDQPEGRVVIKVLEGTGQLGSEFEALLTGKHGFGYKGSRVFACCQNEWILLGDLLYDAPRALTPQSHDWDPMEVDEGKEMEGSLPTRDMLRSSDGETSPRILHRGYTGVLDTQQDTVHSDVRGAVVAVAADLHLDTMTWSLGPQVKICLSDSLISNIYVVATLHTFEQTLERPLTSGEFHSRITSLGEILRTTWRARRDAPWDHKARTVGTWWSGRVLGHVTAGIQVIHRLSQMSEHANFEPSVRITISACGSC